jgi:hypothetical protein
MITLLLETATAACSLVAAFSALLLTIKKGRD